MFANWESHMKAIIIKRWLARESFTLKCIGWVWAQFKRKQLIALQIQLTRFDDVDAKIFLSHVVWCLYQSEKY